MKSMMGKHRILETNVLLERFYTYREVFTEYFKTMKVIERGEALRYETYSRLADNYMSNVDRFVKLCNSYVMKYDLEDSAFADSLNNYFIDLIEAVKCLDFEQDMIDHSSLELAKQKIRNREIEFMDTINLLNK